MLTQEELHRLFTESKGILRNKVQRGTKAVVGALAGGLSSKGYHEIRIYGKMYRAHRIIYVMHHGEIPTGYVIDHINRVPNDNRIENLRAVTQEENLFNTNAKGYSWHNQDKRWQARITVKGVVIPLGHHDTEEEAHSAYLKAKEKYHYIKALDTGNNGKVLEPHL